MAKGNIILGYLRGSIGDITFFRAKGQQLSRARNRAPANPRTVAQMDQRAKMACAVKFFSQVGANFFKYAFEGKKEQESYFNAFVKTNIYTGGYIGKQASRVYDFPALGNWQISAGTLPEITAPFPQTANGVIFNVGTVSGTAINTVSGFTSALISSDSSRWREGDILTCLCYCATNYVTLPTIYTDHGNRVLTSIWQIKLSTTNTDALPSLEFPLLDMTFDCELNSDGFSFLGSSGSEYLNNLYCFGLIHSRNTAKGLKVSSSTIVAPQAPELLVAVSSSTGSYYNAVIADWQATEEAILQGGYVAAQVAPVPTVPPEPQYWYESQVIENPIPATTTATPSDTSPAIIFVVFDKDISELSLNDFRTEGVHRLTYRQQGEEYARLSLWGTDAGQTKVYYGTTLIWTYTRS